jgi:hypothetical protein
MRAVAVLVSSLALASAAVFGLHTRASAEEPDHTFEVRTAPAKGNDTGSLTFVVTPKGRWHWNKEYPAKLTLSAEGVTFPKTVLKQQDGDFSVDKEVATAKLTFTGASAGSKDVSVVGKFGLCDDKVCIIKKVDLKAKVEVSR